MVANETHETYCKIRKLLEKIGAGERSRTADRLITNQLLYQLSYTSSEPVMVVHDARTFKFLVTFNHPFAGFDLHYSYQLLNKVPHGL